VAVPTVNVARASCANVGAAHNATATAPSAAFIIVELLFAELYNGSRDSI
jgi:hypothetical protein